VQPDFRPHRRQRAAIVARRVTRIAEPAGKHIKGTGAAAHGERRGGNRDIGLVAVVESEAP
jgi:hypothetical protein